MSEHDTQPMTAPTPTTAAAALTADDGHHAPHAKRFAVGEVDECSLGSYVRFEDYETLRRQYDATAEGYRAALLTARRENETREALYNRVVALLLAIKHDAEWQDHCVRVQFAAYHAEASALIAELNPRIAARESEVIAAVTGAAATQEGK